MTSPIPVSVASTAGLSTNAAAAPQPAGTERLDAFRSAMERHGAQTDASAAAQAVPQANTVDTVNPVDARARAREGLGLEKTEASGGDVILESMQKLRGVFDQSQSRVAALMNSATVDTRTMMAMQMEVANFSLLVDISSKLTGKSTQSLETLMKGQ